MTHASPPLQGLRILSLALNLPGPAALMRCRRMGAQCVKVEPPSGDPMGHYNREAYAQLHEGVEVRRADLKSAEGQAAVHAALGETDVLLTSFRPSALRKLGLGWEALHVRYPALSQVAIVGAAGGRAEEPGHDLTYLAENGLVTGLELPSTLYADMGGSLMAAEAVLQAALRKLRPASGGAYFEVALSDAAGYLALPRAWGLTQPSGSVGGAHAAYRVYPCRDGRVAVAALEPHFAAALREAAGVQGSDPAVMFDPAARQAIAAFFATRTRAELDALAVQRDLPLHTLPA
ncbi:CoA transferase [Ramlibacter pallidus]|uniref:CoA transferase n=1 Tax=Ramlibacter pallidus TaxID=2780087 RepID=A0ABR9S4B5_9BURK|nr:CoA transferase [Ramlibacter pallidus]MBE7368340.1 CoA transferase [Ramlibacter pallidus]